MKLPYSSLCFNYLIANNIFPDLFLYFASDYHKTEYKTIKSIIKR